MVHGVHKAVVNKLLGGAKRKDHHDILRRNIVENRDDNNNPKFKKADIFCLDAAIIRALQMDPDDSADAAASASPLIAKDMRRSPSCPCQLPLTATPPRTTPRRTAHLPRCRTSRSSSAPSATRTADHACDNANLFIPDATTLTAIGPHCTPSRVIYQTQHHRSTLPRTKGTGPPVGRAHRLVAEVGSVSICAAPWCYACYQAMRLRGAALWRAAVVCAPSVQFAACVGGDEDGGGAGRAVGRAARVAVSKGWVGEPRCRPEWRLLSRPIAWAARVSRPAPRRR